jgi:hypothetical protein
VNGNAVSTRTTYQTVPVITEKEPWPTIDIPCWANFPVSFPAGKDVIIQVTYTAQPYDTGRYDYSYVLLTGSGWKDTIGSADIIFELPYELNETNLISCSPKDCNVGTTKVQWHYENFEPSFNVSVSLIPPPVWQNILIESENTTRNPNDGEAWGRLAKAYKEAIRAKRGFQSDAVGQEMYRLSRDAYQKATTLLPNDADWHFGFAQLLCWNAEWNDFLVDSNTEAWQACVEQIQQVFNLNPNHAEMKQLIEDSPELYDMIDFSGSQPDYLILTPQPTATVTVAETPLQAITTTAITPSPTVQVTKTVTPIVAITSTSTSIPVQTSQKSNTPIYIGGALLLSIAVLMIMKSRKA